MRLIIRAPSAVMFAELHCDLEINNQFSKVILNTELLTKEIWKDKTSNIGYCELTIV